MGPVVFLGVRALTHPLLLLKTQLQVGWRDRGGMLASAHPRALPPFPLQMQVGTHYTLRSTIRYVYRKEGMTGFYKGFGVSALNIAIGQARGPFCDGVCVL